ncbi:immunoglobulin-binding protein 1, partial [Trichonephila clavata]
EKIFKKHAQKADISASTTQEKKTNVVPLKPFITKDALQKEVFGLGYPKVPVLTIDFIARDLKMVEETKQKQKGIESKMQPFAGTGFNKEDEDIFKKSLIEKDDPISLMKARQWDVGKMKTINSWLPDYIVAEGKDKLQLEAVVVVEDMDNLHK